MTVSQAVEAAVNFARECEMLNLCEGGATTYDELISRYSKLDDEKKKKAKAARDAKNAKNARDEKKQPGKRR
jgi:hypothetical protein